MEPADGPALEWAAEQLESTAMHRTATVRDRYEVSFADDVADHPLGRLIKFHGGPTHTFYRVRDDVITEVHRTTGQRKFTITVTDVARTAEGKTLPRHFNVSYFSAASGALDANEDFQEDWIRVGRFDLPQRRLLIKTDREGRQVRELLLSEHKLMPAAR